MRVVNKVSLYPRHLNLTLDTHGLIIQTFRCLISIYHDRAMTDYQKIVWKSRLLADIWSRIILQAMMAG